MSAAHTVRLAALERLCFSEPWSENALAEEIENPAACFLTAVENDEVLGYAGMHTVLGESYVDNIAVFPEHRGRGVGRALTQALIDRAKATNGAFITLEVRASNYDAIALYGTRGFRGVGRRKNYYEHPREDAIIMTREFNTDGTEETVSGTAEDSL